MSSEYNLDVCCCGAGSSDIQWPPEEQLCQYETGKKTPQDDLPALQLLVNNIDAGPHLVSYEPVAERGLRRCAVCGSVLSTPLHMHDHLVGKKHCEQVARRHLAAHWQDLGYLSSSGAAASRQTDNGSNDPQEQQQRRPRAQEAMVVSSDEARAAFYAQSSAALLSASHQQTLSSSGNSGTDGGNGSNLDVYKKGHEVDGGMDCGRRGCDPAPEEEITQRQDELLAVDAADVALVLLDYALSEQSLPTRAGRGGV